MLNRHLTAKMELILSPQHLLPRVASTALALTLLSSCEALRPADVCRADNTLTAVGLIIQQNGARGRDPILARQAFDDLFQTEMIAFEGYDRQTRRVSCSAQLISRASGPITFTYARNPEVGENRYIYEVDMTEAAWVEVRYQFGQWDPALDTLVYRSSSQSAPPPSVPVETTTSAPMPTVKGGHVNGFPLGHRSPGAFLATIEHTDTPAAIMTGRVTRASALEFCTNASTPEVESCIAEQIANTPGELIASANCQTHEILTSGGLPFRREQGGWRNDRTGEVVADDDSPASGILVIQTQFETLCPKAARALK